MVDFVGISIDESKVLEISEPKAMAQRWRISILLNDGSTLVSYNSDKKYLEDVRQYILDAKHALLSKTDEEAEESEEKKKTKKRKKSFLDDKGAEDA